MTKLTALARCRRATVGIIAAVSAVPVIASAGAGIDMARLSMAKSALQAAVDEAALAGAAAYQSSGMGATAGATATSYFNRYAGTVSGLLSITDLTVTPGTGNNSQGLPSYTISVSATATLAKGFMSIVNVSSMSIGAQAAGANPIVQPVISVGNVGARAGDFNSVYMYPVPNGNAGSPDYSSVGPVSRMYEIGSNCGPVAVNYSINSRCNGMLGATVSPTQPFPAVTATQPLGFLMVNVNNGLASAAAPFYPGNQFGALPGNVAISYTGPLSLGQGPTQNTDATAALVQQLIGYTLVQPATHYADVANSAKPNCSLVIQAVDPNNLPTDPPVSGSCLTATDPMSGAQYANMSCAQMAGRTFMYWWNDLGGSWDDHDYNDFYFTVRCTPGNAGPNGGTLTNAAVAYPNLSVTLIQ